MFNLFFSSSSKFLVSSLRFAIFVPTKTKNEIVSTSLRWSDLKYD